MHRDGKNIVEHISTYLRVAVGGGLGLFGFPGVPGARALTLTLKRHRGEDTGKTRGFQPSGA